MCHDSALVRARPVALCWLPFVMDACYEPVFVTQMVVRR
jgi:hypothetical protein